MINNKIWYLIVFLFSLSAVSCKKNDSALDNLAKDLSHYTSSYVEKGSAMRLNGNTYNDTTLTFFGVPVTLSGTSNQEVIVHAAIDTTLIQSYNTMYGESNPLFTASSFKVSFNGEFHVKAGALASTDSLYVLLKSASKLTDSTTYLIPVRLTTDNGVKVKTSVVFFKMFVTTTAISAYINGSSYFGYNSGYNYNGSIFYNMWLPNDGTGHSVGPDYAKFSAFCTTPVSSMALNVHGIIDDSDSLRNAYSTASGYYHFQPFPPGSYEMTKSVALLPAGKYLTSDSLEIRITHYELFQPNVNYLLGVRLVGDPTDPYGMPPRNDASSVAYIGVYIY